MHLRLTLTAMHIRGGIICKVNPFLVHFLPKMDWQYRRSVLWMSCSDVKPKEKEIVWHQARHCDCPKQQQFCFQLYILVCHLNMRQHSPRIVTFKVGTKSSVVASVKCEMNAKIEHLKLTRLSRTERKPNSEESAWLTLSFLKLCLRKDWCSLRWGGEIMWLEEQMWKKAELKNTVCFSESICFMLSRMQQNRVKFFWAA